MEVLPLMRLNSKYVFSVFLIWTAYVFCNCANVPALQSLYNISDQVTVLENKTLKSTVYNSEQAWFVQFYSSWCGHCLHFAPVWKAFAVDISGWQSIARLGAVNCADQKNSKICSQNIDVGFPTLRLFRALQKNGTGDVSKGQRDVIHLRHALIDHISKHSGDYKPSHWPRLEPVGIKWLLEDSTRSTKPGVTFRATVFEDAESYAGRELILDTMARTDVVIVRVLQPDLNNSVANWKITRLPSLFVYKQNEEPKELLFKSDTRESIHSSLEAYLNQSELKIKDQSRASSNLAGIDERNHRGNDEHRVTALQRINGVMQDRETLPTKTRMRSVVSMQDLESTLVYSLKHEVGLQRVISAQALEALKAFILVLNKYFPGRLQVMNVLSNLQRMLEPKSQLSNDDWFKILQRVKGNLAANQQFAVFLENEVRWLSCQGSTHVYRGYPCGLWTLFHTLTVSQAALNSNDVDADAKEVLNAMKGYMKYFFGCRECSENFAEESISLDSSVVSLDDSILWLWETHNRVNKRLAGALSEDPEYPKVQFPSETECKLCHDPFNPSHWKTSAVLHYLKELYSVKNIDMKVDKLNRRVTFGYFTIGINATDISMCLLLYSLCSVLLVVICIYINHRRKRKHVKYII
ncbi:sulfhydryl oxidase 1-like isoform X1 [Asterias rubens]|uniref:sulfhydryl oxidase 1-like isoform X1 n=1 Tax=Asterias rubens TaxID=7604 RepID=UPI001454FA16|nr:sulfhydryl oxidase 1-like isoform X1 [Asterias rubens]